MRGKIKEKNQDLSTSIDWKKEDSTLTKSRKKFAIIPSAWGKKNLYKVIKFISVERLLS